jgi:hypothetical protein
MVILKRPSSSQPTPNWRYPLHGLLIVLLFAVGCSPKGPANVAEVSGKVTFNGAPVTGGTIQLIPSGGGAPQILAIQPDGTFRVGSIPLGDYKVTVETESAKGALERMFPNPGQGPTEAELAQMPPHLRPQMPPQPPAGAQKADYSKMPPEMKGKIPMYVEIPTKYADPSTSGLTWEIKNSSEKKDFNLQ